MIPHDTPHGQDNCGIAVVAMLSGVSYAEAEKVFMYLCGKSDMTTVWDRLDVMSVFGVEFSEDIYYRKKPTLTAWWRQPDVGLSDSKYHVTMTGHVIAIDKGLLFDQVFRHGINPLTSPYKRKRILSYQKVLT